MHGGGSIFEFVKCYIGFCTQGALKWIRKKKKKWVARALPALISSNFPKIGIAMISSGGYRVAQYGAGALCARCAESVGRDCLHRGIVAGHLVSIRALTGRCVSVSFKRKIIAILYPVGCFPLLFPYGHTFQPLTWPQHKPQCATHNATCRAPSGNGFCFPDTVIRTACLRPLHGGRSTKRVSQNQNRMNDTASITAGTDVSLTWSLPPERTTQPEIPNARSRNNRNRICRRTCFC